MSEPTDFGGLVCETQIPFSWMAGDGATPLADTFDFTNQSRLKIILALDEVSHDVTEESGEHNQELQRLDFKINIVLELLSQMMSRNLALPPPAALKLSPHVIEWQTVSPPVPGQHGQMELFLDHRFPCALLLTGQVEHVAPLERGHHLVRIKLDVQAEVTQDLFEKYIFRCHRRHVARMKSRRKSD